MNEMPPIPNLPSPQPASAGPVKTSAAAITGFVLAVLSPITCGLTALPGLIFGIVGIVKTGTPKLKGRGLAIAGTSISAVFLLLLPFFVGMNLAIMMPALARVRTLAYEMLAQTNLQQISEAVQDYAADHDGTLPTAASWVDDISGYDVHENAFNWPDKTQEGRTWAMNARLAGRRLSDIRDLSRTVLIFECAPGSPPSGGKELLPPEPRGRSGYLVLFADGHIEPVWPEEIDKLIWEP